MDKSIEITRRLIDAESADCLLFKHQEVSKNGNRQYAHGFRDARKIISEQPTIDAVPVVHGRWNFGRTFNYSDFYVCSECGAPTQGKPPFCCNCGARMDAEEAQSDGK